MLIVSKPVVNKSKRGANLLAENPMSVPPKPLRLPTREPKPRERPRKRPCVENEPEQDDFANDGTSMIGTVGPRNQLAQKPRIDQGGISSENPPAEELIRPMQEFANSVTETISKV